MFPAISIKEKSPTSKKWMKHIIFLEGLTRFISCLLYRKQGGQSEDPNLPIDDRRKIILPYETITKHQ